MKAIIFDMDGVLVDSMFYHAEAWRLAFKTHDIDIDRSAIYELEGSNHIQIVELIFRRFGRVASQEDIQELCDTKIKIFNRIESVKPFEGIKELLASLKLKYRLAVVSGSNRETVRGIINTFFPDTFEVIVDGDDTRKSKPSPDPYLRAVKRLRIPAKHCLVVENSPLGIRSAKSAGLRCIAIPAYLGRERMKGADVIAESHRELGRYIDKEAKREEEEETGIFHQKEVLTG